MKTKDARILILIALDFLAVVVAYFMAYFLRFGEIAGFLQMFTPVFLALAPLGYILVFSFFELYRPLKAPFSPRQLIEIWAAVGMASVLVLLAKYALVLFPIGRGVLAISTFLLFWLVPGIRALFLRLMPGFFRPVKIFLVGPENLIKNRLNFLANFSGELEVTGFEFISPDFPSQSTEASGLKNEVKMKNEIKTGNEARTEKEVRPGLEFLRGAINSGAEIILVDLEEQKFSFFLPDVLRARAMGIEVCSWFEFYEKRFQRVPLEAVSLQGNRWLERINQSLESRPLRQNIKRFLDISISALILLLTLPLWPLIALAIKIDSKGPVFYIQRRIGQHRRVFNLYKFRSMIEEAEKMGPSWAEENDRRVTRIGRLLRRFHLDELPQLINVLKGDMSLIGPRPERPEFIELLEKEIPAFPLRYLARPGITGWAQVNFPYASSIEATREKLEYDLYYLIHQSFLLDLLIMARTLRLYFSPPKKT